MIRISASLACLLIVVGNGYFILYGLPTAGNYFFAGFATLALILFWKR